MSLYVGLMSGTSLDGIDTVLVDFPPDNHTLTLLASETTPLPGGIRDKLLKLIDGCEHELALFAELDQSLGLLFADCVNRLLAKTQTSAESVIAIGSHGQTLRHYPDSDYPTSLQIADPNLIAELTGITTVADFRRRDMAAGGQGAPLVPAFHHAIFHHPELNRVIVNIGGIANITVLPAVNNHVFGFDTGPGNSLIDFCAMQHFNSHYDPSGEIAARGEVNRNLLNAMLQDPYFSRHFPKSTGREYFNYSWVERYLKQLDEAPEPENIQTTLTELTAITITDAIKQAASRTEEVLVCGGGAHNNWLMERIQAHLPECSVESTASYGLEPDWVEACAFAWLARRNLSHQAGNLPEVTGAHHPVILGGVWQGKRP